MAQWQCCVFQFSTLMISFKPRGVLRIEWQNECLSWPSASHASSMALKQLSKTGVRVPRLSVSWPWQALQTWPSGFLRACCTWTTDRESTFRATGDVFITPGSTYLYWESEQLRRAVAENEWLHRAIIALIALTLANKLTDDYRAPEPLPTRLRSRAQAKHSSKLDA